MDPFQMALMPGICCRNVDIAKREQRRGGETSLDNCRVTKNLTTVSVEGLQANPGRTSAELGVSTDPVESIRIDRRLPIFRRMKGFSAAGPPGSAEPMAIQRLLDQPDRIGRDRCFLFFAGRMADPNVKACQKQSGAKHRASRVSRHRAWPGWIQ